MNAPQPRLATLAYHLKKKKKNNPNTTITGTHVAICTRGWARQTFPSGRVAVIIVRAVVANEIAVLTVVTL